MNKRDKDYVGIRVNGLPLEDWRNSMETPDRDWVFLAAAVVVAAVGLAYAFFTH